MLGIRLQVWAMAALGVVALVALVSSWSPSGPAPSDQAASPARLLPGRGGASDAGIEPKLASPGPAPDAAATAAPPPAAEKPREAASQPLPRQKSRAEVELQERVRERARELGVELPQKARDAIDDMQPLPGEDEPAFADRLRDAELDAISDEYLTEALLWRRYRSEVYRWGEPTSQYRKEASQRVSGMTPEQRMNQLAPELNRDDGPVLPSFYPPDQVPPYDGPDAEPPPEPYRLAPPELYEPPDLFPSSSPPTPTGLRPPSDLPELPESQPLPQWRGADTPVSRPAPAAPPVLDEAGSGTSAGGGSREPAGPLP